MDRGKKYRDRDRDCYLRLMKGEKLTEVEKKHAQAYARILEREGDRQAELKEALNTKPEHRDERQKEIVQKYQKKRANEKIKNQQKKAAALQQQSSQQLSPQPQSSQQLSPPSSPGILLASPRDSATSDSDQDDVAGQIINDQDKLARDVWETSTTIQKHAMETYLDCLEIIHHRLTRLQTNCE